MKVLVDPGQKETVFSVPVFKLFVIKLGSFIQNFEKQPVLPKAAHLKEFKSYRLRMH